jgi:hypothetical protein
MESPVAGPLIMSTTAPDDELIRKLFGYHRAMIKTEKICRGRAHRRHFFSGELYNKSVLIKPPME